MKVNKYIISALVCPFVLGSCADWDDWKYDVEKPQTIAQYEYLNDYAPLKEYLDRGAHPGFKVSAALGVDEFNQQGPLFRLAAHNFDEIVAGNAMKMASCVNDQGEMDFSKVSSFVHAAEDAGLTVYGHALAWHAQQPSKYLNGLIKDKELPPAEENPGLIITAGAPKKDTWEYEIYYDLDKPLQAGKTYEISLNVRGTNPGTIDFWPGKKDGSDTQYGAGSFTVAEKAIDNSFSFTPNADIDRLRFCFGKIGGTLYFDNFVLKEKGSDHNIAVNSTFDEKDISHWTKVSWVDISYKIGNVAGAGAVEIPVSVGHLTFDDGQNLGGWGMDNAPEIVNGVCEVGNNAAKENPWNAQVCYKPGFAFENGTTYHLKMKIKGSVAGEFGAGFQNPDGYKGCGDFPTINVTTDWKEVDVTTTCNGDNAKRLLLNIGKYAGTLYIDDFEVYYTKSSNSIPLTAEEKKNILTSAMQKWISGMMQATEGKVKAWDLINEAVSGGGNVNGFYALQTEATSEHNPQDFYWQDYFTPEMYGPIVEKAARDAYAAVEGTNPADLKLFINDYNLESDWDSNKKVKSLVYWIGVWEKKGQELGWNTKIDGIGSQMHISYYENPQTLESKKKAIQNMLKIMAETGKLVRISEIDMGYVDKDGKDVTTAQLEKLPIEERVAKEKAMAEHYKWIIEQYFKIVPVSQQYGICQWCLTDSPTDSGWRPGQPVGLWNLNYQRKPAYGGFADGLASSAKGESDVK
ncbi:endo-1,4-beta-xylanase [Segatella copri]|uniref:endo-1,4-beta-xylanase n=1 Tax=Segatella copri TaxID=165179 RepID=UPI002232061B|nr:endo-1,4-beta-xylanase [Segatella copri]MCW4085219.1 endo-1,4-beta-xylanase [Segatella copri]MCW4160097.1 endo-1,4-beta-xylanase [Segatella copri]